MPRHVPLPPEFGRDPFRVGEARDAGVSEGRLRGRDLQRPFRGVRTPRTIADPTEFAALVRRCGEYAPLLGPGRFFSHLTAARLWGCPLPWVLTDREPLHVGSLAPARAPRRPGIAGHQADPGLLAIVFRYEFPVADAASMWLQLAPFLSLDDLVAVGDALILDPVVLDPYDIRPWITLDELTRRVLGFTGRGARAAASAIPKLRHGVESRPETLLRLLIIRSGLPEPIVNFDVTDAAGRILGRGDLVYPRWKTVVEYDGDEHRTNPRQYDRDITRIEDFVHADWTVVRVRSRGLFITPEDTIARIARALRSHGWRP